MKKQLQEIKLLLKNKDNKKWYLKNWGVKLIAYFTTFVTAWTVLEGFDISLTHFLEKLLPGSTIILLIVAASICIIVSGIVCIGDLKGYSSIRVETERAGCSVEIRVADSYLTNAFHNYPNASMIIGLNKAFWFQEAEPGSLVADMWKILKEKGIDKKDVQKQIDAELKALWTNADGTENITAKEKYIDTSRKTVLVKSAEEADGCVLRDNYKIGTMIGVDLKWEEGGKKKLKKLFLFANSEVVQGANTDEPMKVTYDRKVSAVASYSKIWDFFEAQEMMNEKPPRHILYTPLLMPLIGAGVANEGYSDLAIFSNIVDLYYERLRKSIRKDVQPAIPNLIINIQGKTAIESKKNNSEGIRKIDLKTAFWYLKYRNEVKPVQNIEE